MKKGVNDNYVKVVGNLTNIFLKTKEGIST